VTTKKSENEKMNFFLLITVDKHRRYRNILFETFFAKTTSWTVNNKKTHTSLQNQYVIHRSVQNLKDFPNSTYCASMSTAVHQT